MKVITPDAGYSSYTRIFKEVQTKKQKVVLWQVSDKGRTVCETLLISYTVEEKRLNLLPPPEKLNPGMPVYFYMEDAQVIFKGLVEDLSSTNLSVSFPAEIRALDDSEESVNFRKNHLSTMWVNRTGKAADRISHYIKIKTMKERSERDQEFLNNEFSASLDAEEKMFADKRESPRMRPKIDKLVKIVKKGESRTFVLKLFDLSRGGLAFVTFAPQDFPKGSEVFVTGFDTFDLDDPLVGKVMSHRALDANDIEHKIGIKFDEGQE